MVYQTKDICSLTLYVVCVYMMVIVAGGLVCLAFTHADGTMEHKSSFVYLASLVAIAGGEETWGTIDDIFTI